MPALNDTYGWYESVDQPHDKPSSDPGYHAPCLYCGNSMTDDDVRTHSFIPYPGEEFEINPNKSYFYRTHRTCDDDATEDQKDELLNAVIARIVFDEKSD